jgi:hypothetical protein
LNLGSTSLQISLPASFTKTLSNYGSASKFLGGAYLLALILTLLTQLLGLLAACAPRAIYGGAITSFLATVFLLAASGLSFAIFKAVKNAFDSDLGPAGIKTAFGDKLYVLTWVATVLSFISTILVCLSGRKSKIGGIRRGMIVPSATDKDGSNVGIKSATAGPKPLTLLQRSLTWNKHKYAAVGKKQSPVVKITGAPGEEDEDILLEQRGFGGGEDEEDEEGFSRGTRRGIPLMSMGGSGKVEKDMNTAYEPFAHV